MAISVHTNYASLVTQNTLQSTNNALTKSMERLSTGFRINSAADDAAGLQIANRLNLQSRGLGVAMRNSQDAISMMQTAEGALSQMTDIAYRMNDLATQAANGSLTDDDRSALQAEYTKLGSELGNIYENTNFGGRSLFSGASTNSFSSSNIRFQIGSTSSETLSVDFMSQAKGIGQVSEGFAIADSAQAAYDLAYSTNYNSSFNTQYATDYANNYATDYTADLATEYSQAKLDAATNLSGTETDLVAAFTTQDGGGTFGWANGGALAYGSAADVLNGGNAADIATLMTALETEHNSGTTDWSVDAIAAIEGTTAGDDWASGATEPAYANLGAVLAGGQRGDIQQFAAEVDVQVGSASALSKLIGAADTAAHTSANSSASIAANASADTAAVTAATTAATTAADSAVQASTSNYGKDYSSMTYSTLQDTVLISNQTNASAAIDKISGFLGQLSSLRAEFGANINRLDYSISNSASMSENLNTARGRIMDTDFASESGMMSKSQMLMQSGASMLSASKMVPQLAMSLLG